MVPDADAGVRAAMFAFTHCIYLPMVDEWKIDARMPKIDKVKHRPRSRGSSINHSQHVTITSDIIHLVLH